MSGVVARPRSMATPSGNPGEGEGKKAAGARRVGPAAPLTKEEISQLTLEGMAALAARCALRVMPVFRPGEGRDERADYYEAVEAACLSAALAALDPEAYASRRVAIAADDVDATGRAIRTAAYAAAAHAAASAASAASDADYTARAACDADVYAGVYGGV